LATGGRSIGALAFTEDGKRLFAAQGPRVLVWTLDEPAVQRSFHGDSALRDTSDIETLAISPNGTFVAVLGGGGIQFWNLDSGEPVGERVALPLGTLRRLHFSQDGRWLAVAGLEGFFLLALDASNWRHLACSRAQRTLSCEEWSRFVRVPRYRTLCPGFASPPSC
jgi:WD40 repeat protein